MKAHGLILGMFVPIMNLLMIFSFFAACLAMVFADVPFVLVVVFGVLTLYLSYYELFMITKYQINNNGIKTESFLPLCNKEFHWNNVIIIEKTILNVTNRGRGVFGEYYVISIAEDIEREKGLMEMMKQNNVICVPVTKNTKACMTYIAPEYKLSIVPKKYTGDSLREP